MPFTVIGSEPLTQKITARITENEKVQVSEQARLAGLSVSALIRRWCLHRKVIADVDMVMIRELRRIGGLVKHIHNDSGGAYQAQTAAILHELGEAIKRISCDRQENR